MAASSASSGCLAPKPLNGYVEVVVEDYISARFGPSPLARWCPGTSSPCCGLEDMLMLVRGCAELARLVPSAASSTSPLSAPHHEPPLMMAPGALPTPASSPLILLPAALLALQPPL